MLDEEQLQISNLIEKQVELENKYSMQGMTNYITQTQSRPASETDYAKIMYKTYVEPLALAIEKIFEKPLSRYKQMRELTEGLSYNAMAYITLHTMVEELSTANCTIQQLSLKVAKYIHTELLIQSFNKQNPLYMKKLLESFKHSQTNSPRHKSRVAMYTANKLDIEYNEWDNKTALNLGALLVMIVCNNFQIAKIVKIQKGIKKINYVDLTQDFKEWANKQTHEIAKLKVCKPPCIVPPKPWTGFDDGGYYTPEQQLTTKFVTTTPRHWKTYRKHFNNMPLVVSAVNALQNTAWHINETMLDVLTDVWENGGKCLPNKNPLEVPAFDLANGKAKADMTEEELQAFKEWKSEAREIYTQEKKRFGKALAISRTLSLAKDYASYDRIYFVYTADFRGRLYASSYGISPQGADYSKGLLEFAEGVPLTERGIYWIKVHTANCYGIDKVSFDDRVKWVDDNMQLILDVAKDPKNNISWQEADKPFQFLRACLEIYAIKAVGASHRSKLPVGVDGSCNGLQNFSALLRDPIGGKATNLVPDNKPNDIYQEVANVLINKVKEDGSQLGKELLEFGITRKMAKKPVMTLPYGSTKITCFKSICDYLEDNGYTGDVNKAARYLSPKLWDSIGEIVVAAMQAMDWLKKTASIICKANQPIMWYSPTNFLVIQDKKVSKVQHHAIIINLLGKIKLSCKFDTPVMDIIKNKNGISPNFIHSMDSSHLVFTINKCLDNGIKQFACVHDDYGTYANDIDKLNIILREEFINIYSNYNILQDIVNYYKDKDIILPELPNTYNLDINIVKDSKYFFC